MKNSIKIIGLITLEQEAKLTVKRLHRKLDQAFEQIQMKLKVFQKTGIHQEYDKINYKWDTNSNHSMTLADSIFPVNDVYDVCQVCTTKSACKTYGCREKRTGYFKF